MCQHKQLLPLTAKRVKWTPETTYRDIENSFNMTHINK